MPATASAVVAAAVAWSGVGTGGLQREVPLRPPQPAPRGAYWYGEPPGRRRLGSGRGGGDGLRSLLQGFGEVGERSADGMCCSEEQVVLLVDYALYMATCVLLWYSRVLMPLKLFTTFLHELGHALAVWLTCNKVHGIEVHADQGGVTKWSTTRLRCSSHFVLPAGYLGSAAWGGAILVCCSSPETTYAITFVLIFFLLVALGYSAFAGTGGQGDCTLPGLCVGMLAVFGTLLGVCFGTEWPYRDLLLNKVLLLVGVMNTLFATYDIWTDCVSRTVERSDAYKYAELIGCCCTSVCVGTIWMVLSLALAVAMLYLALSLMPSEPEFDGTFSAFSWASMLVPAAVLGAAVAFRLLCSRTYGGKMTRGVVLEGDSAEDDSQEEEQRKDRRPEETPRGVEVFVTTGLHWAGHTSGSDSEGSDGSDCSNESDQERAV